jgi:hypothetical protein
VLKKDFLEPFTVNGLPLHTQWFMQDGVTPHIANVVLHLNTDLVFASYQTAVQIGTVAETCDRVSLDLISCDFLLWLFFKEAFPQKPFTDLGMTGMLAEFVEGLRKT